MTDQRTSKQDGFEESTRSSFEASVATLDARTRSRLTRARHVALAELNVRRSRSWARARMALAGVTAASVLAVSIGLIHWGSLPPEAAEVALDDFDMAAENPGLELLEDVEFYAWIAEQQDPSG
jgi:hypothetical protein